MRLNAELMRAAGRRPDEEADHGAPFSIRTTNAFQRLTGESFVAMKDGVHCHDIERSICCGTVEVGLRSVWVDVAFADPR